jgi:hypothetical protein
MPLRAVHAFNIKVVEIGHQDTAWPSVLIWRALIGLFRSRAALSRLHRE